MDYLRVGRATDLKNKKERRIFRFFEILPGAISWSTLFLAFFLSWKAPFFISCFLIILVVFWFFLGIYFSFHTFAGFRRMRIYEKTNWLKKIDNLPSGHHCLNINTWKDIYHLILLPTYKEPFELIDETIDLLVNSDYPKEKMMVVLSFEERAGESRKLVAERIQDKFQDKFFKFLVTFHPADLQGEIAGHGSNDAWAAKQAKKLLIDPSGIDYKNLIISCFDIDAHIYSQYFTCLTYHYLTCSKPTRTSFQPIPLYHNNIWEAPSFSQTSSFTNTFWQITCQERPEDLISFSSHSMSFQAMVDVGFKQANIVPDDSRIFWQCFFRYNGDYRVMPIFYPISMDSNIGKNAWVTLKNIYKQKRRWAYGVEDIPYFLFACMKNKEIPLTKKISRGLRLFYNHWSWATNSILIFSLGWLPIFLGGNEYNNSLLAYSVPQMASHIMTFAMIGLITSIWLSLILLPPKPLKYGKYKYFVFILSWILVPVYMMTINTIPALDAQTRCMLGKYMGFWVTPKDRRKS